MRDLVLPHRHERPAHDRDVHRLQDRVSEQAEVRDVALGHVAEPLLERRDALQPSERRDHAEQQRHLRHLGQVGLPVDDRARRIDPGGQQVEHEPLDRGGQHLGAVVVRREHVPVRHEVEALVALVLEADGVADVARPVTHMQRPGRSEAGQHARAAVGGGGGLVDGR